MLILVLTTGTAAACGAVGGLALSFSKLPDVRTLSTYVPHETTKIYDCHGKLLANVHGEENRVVVPLHDIPRNLQLAVIAMEDTDFYHHFGINLKGITRAMLEDVAEGGAVEGASTLTQQLAKNLFLDRQKTLARKLDEAWLAIQIEHHYSKAQILEMYLNQVYWGHNAYGVEAASQNYFGKSCRKLNLAECALLAGLLRGPEYYSPYRNPKGAKFLQGLVLERMREAGFINRKQEQLADKAPLRYPGITSFKYRVPYFTSTIIETLDREFGERQVLEGGLRVYTTLDVGLQEKAEQMVRDYIAHHKYFNAHQAALVAIEPKTGYVKALVGGVDFNKSKFNRATQALRPPGSTFKAFVYLTALAEGFSPGTVMVDGPVSLPDGYGHFYAPQDYERSYEGPVTLREALEKSINVVAVKLGYQVGIPNVIKTAHAMGITSALGDDLSLPLGTSDVTPLEMCSAYSVLANDGMRNNPIFITKVLDRNGRVIEENRPHPHRVFDSLPVRMLVDMMRDVIRHGTGIAAYIGRPAAGKTGTTSDERDCWFDGYTPELCTVVWMGNDNNSQLSYSSTGGAVCAPLWAEFMNYALRNKPATDFPAPTGYTEATINRHTGKLTNPMDKDAITEKFMPGGAPTDFQPMDTPQPTSAPATKKAAPARPHRPKKTPIPVTDETLLEPMPGNQ
ncbi:MAG TPA: penicillin-binding protein 1A [Oscillatoriaceae cyanobacterium]